jgi:dienelactone hydrolase
MTKATACALVLPLPILALLVFAAGAELQAGYFWWSRLILITEAPPYEDFQVSGDPSLSKLVQTTPIELPRPEISNALALASWQASTRAVLRTDLFGLPERHEPSPSEPFRVLSSVDLSDGLRRQFVTFSGFDGTSIPGYLHYTPGAPRRPAILVLSGHGHGVVETAGLMSSYQNGVARALAKLGYVTFTPEMRGFGYLGARIGSEHRAVARNALAAGTFYKAVALQDLTIAVDRLMELPHVDGRLAATGVSFGGELAAALTALDPRIQLAVVQGFGGESVGPDRGESGTYHSVCNHYCHFIPRSNNFMHEEDLALLVAPRPLMFVRGSQEGLAGSALWPVLRTSYEALGHASRFSFVQHRGYHEYWLEPAIPFIQHHLPLHHARSGRREH